MIDTYENTGPMHLSDKYPIGIVEGGREKFCMHSSAKSAAKRSDARMTPNSYQRHTHTPKEEAAVFLIAGSEKNKLLIAFAKAGIIQAATRALTALKLHLNYI